MAKKTATFAQRLREGLDLRGMKQDRKSVV